MKARLSTKHVTFEIDAVTQKELFKAIAECQEVFAEETCGMCGSDMIRFTVRTVEGNDYFEMACSQCYARLSFGQSKQNKGFLFPIRKLIKATGKPDRVNGDDWSTRGWTKYRGEMKEAEEAVSPPTKRR